MGSHDGRNDLVDCEFSLLASDRPINYGHFIDFDLSAAGLLVPQEKEILRAFGADKGTENVNLTLGIEYAPGTIPNKGIDVVGILTWGTGDVTQRAEIDWKEGANLAVPCSIIQLQGRVTVLGPPATGIVQLRANIAWGPGSRTYVTRTLRVTVPQAGNITIPIPKFAARFFPLPADAGALAGGWAMLTALGGDVLNVGTVLAAQYPGAEIPNEAKVVTLTAAAGSSFNALFLLCL